MSTMKLFILVVNAITAYNYWREQIERIVTHRIEHKYDARCVNMS